MTVVYICECEHPKSQHKRERDGCRALDCGCGQFEADLKASAEAQGATLASGGIMAYPPDALCRCGDTFAEHDHPGCEFKPTGSFAPEVAVTAADTLSTSARLAKVEGELALARGELDSWRGHSQTQKAEIARLEALVIERTTELASARQEIEQLRERLAAMREAGARLIRERDIAREAVQKAAEISASFGVLYVYDAWSCLTEGGCGSRYTRETAIQDHPCGPLTPVRVSITHRSEGTPTA